MSMPLSHFIPAYSSPSQCPQVHSLCLHLYPFLISFESIMYVCMYVCIIWRNSLFTAYLSCSLEPWSISHHDSLLLGQGALAAISTMLPITVITCALSLTIKCCHLPLLLWNLVFLVDTGEPSFITVCPAISLSLQRTATTKLLSNNGVSVSSAFLITAVNEMFSGPFQEKSAGGFSHHRQ